MQKKIIKKIIKTKLLILLSLFSVKPALSSNYHASSKVKVTIKTASTKGYKTSNDGHNKNSNTITVTDNAKNNNDKSNFKVRKIAKNSQNSNQTAKEVMIINE